MIKSLSAVAMTAMLLAACGQKDAVADGPAVSSPPSPMNQAVDTTPTQDAPAVSAGASSFTESQARGAFEKAGYTAIGPLTQNSNGIWQGKATKDGAEVNVAIDYKGAITQP